VGAVTVAAAPAFAQDFNTQLVSYADLDLTSPAGVTTLDARLDRAVRRVCRSNDRLTLQNLEHARACQTAARSEADRQRRGVLANHAGGTIRAVR
jgi:UrcA family protein